MKRFVLLTLAGLVLLSVCGCGKAGQIQSTADTTDTAINTTPEISETSSETTAPQTEPQTTLTYNTSPAIFGVGEDLDALIPRGDLDAALDLIIALGAKSFRNWMWPHHLLTSPDTVNRERADIHHHIIQKLREGGVTQIVGCGHTWFYPEGVVFYDSVSVPERDLTEGSDYMRFLELFETMWRTLAAEFPEVEFWEVGNENNHAPFLHPLNYNLGHTFSNEESALITCDMMFYASRGIHSANPNAVVVMPGLAPVTGLGGQMVAFLRFVYEFIEQGVVGNGSTNPRDYFGALAWHPYVEAGMNKNWLNANHFMYSVAQDHGDDGIMVFLTEFGYRDEYGTGLDRNQAGYMRQAYAFVVEQMPYVEAMHTYILTDNKSVDKWAGNNMGSYGLFTLDDGYYSPKIRAYALQEVFGGTGDLTAYAKKEQ